MSAPVPLPVLQSKRPSDPGLRLLDVGLLVLVPGRPLVVAVAGEPVPAVVDSLPSPGRALVRLVGLPSSRSA